VYGTLNNLEIKTQYTFDFKRFTSEYQSAILNMMPKEFINRCGAVQKSRTEKERHQKSCSVCISLWKEKLRSPSNKKEAKSRCGATFPSEKAMQRHRKECPGCKEAWTKELKDLQTKEAKAKTLRAAERWAELDKLVPQIIELRDQWPFPNKEEISKILGIPFDTLGELIKRNNIQITARSIPYHVIEKAIGLRSKGETSQAISAQTGIKNGTLAAVFSRSGVKLTEEQRLKIASTSKPLKYSREEVEQAIRVNGIALDEPADTRMTGTLRFICRCGRKFSCLMSDAIRGFTRSCGCVKSFDQLELAELIESWGIPVIKNDRSVITPKEIDIWIPSLKIGIEYCGLHWHGERVNGSYARVKHLEKLELCEKAGIRLITIFSSEWLTKRQATEGFLRSILGVHCQRVGARKTSVVTVTESQAVTFLDANHILGSTKSGCEHLGLEVDGDLVSLASFSLRKNEWTMTRYCLKSGVSVTGGFQKLIYAFKKLHPEAKSLVTFSDRRWSLGEIYRRNGFKQIHVTPQSYWYFKENGLGEIYHKSNFRKDKIGRILGSILPGETEWEAMLRFRYDRIWDCGLVKWELKL